MQLYAIIIKELRLLYRDIHGLALLFVMPVVFILIMSLAMKADFDRRSGVQRDVLVVDLANNDNSRALLAQLGENALFRLLPLPSSGDEAIDKIRTDEHSFLLTINDNAFDEQHVTIAHVLAAPGNSPELNQLLSAALREAIAAQQIALMLKPLNITVPEVKESDQMIQMEYAGISSLEVSSESGKAPTSVQQNVPAWLVFSMFFVVVPLANTLINERQLGTLRRLRTIDVASWKLMAGKIIPYFAINQLQVVAMLLVGIYLVPLLGGDRLTLGQSTGGLVVMSSALSLAALGYGMLIAVIARTTEQATTLGGAGNIILAALGGIMVPAFVMPQFMQTISIISPMSWGLQGFLDVLLRGGGVAEVWPEAVSLLLLGLITLATALLLLHRHTQ